MTLEETRENAVFTVSLQSSVRGLEIICLVLTVICLLLAYYGIAPVVPGVVLAFELYLLIRARSNRPRRALFYESHARMEGPRSTNDFEYDQISDVAKVSVFPILGSKTQVRIRVKNMEGPYTIVANPMIKRLNIDLYSWLKGRQKNLDELF